MIKTLSQPAMETIQQYLHLPFSDRDVSCPYYNNRRGQVRGALRVLVGKGSVEDILDEAMILSLKHRVDLNAMNSEQLKQFLVDHHIGIDCSGLAYYILDAELRARKLVSLKRQLRFSSTINPLRWLLRQLRTVENTSVDVLSNPSNSLEVPVMAVQPGDMIVMLGTGRDHTMNHVLIVHEVQSDDNLPKILSYTHTLQWSTDGKYHHGVRQGIITIVDNSKGLLEQSWEEQHIQGEANETYVHAKLANNLTIKRLHAFQTSSFVLPLQQDTVETK